MYVGEIKILRLGAIDRVAVGNSKLISTSALEGGQLVLLAEGEGVTSLHIWLQNGSELDYTVAVGATLTRKGTDEVRDLLRDVPGMEVREVGESIVLSGTIDPRWMPIIETVTGQYSGIMDLTQKTAPILPADKMVFMNVKITEFNTNKLQDLGIEWDNPIAGPSAAVNFEAVNNDQFRAQASDPPGVSFAADLPFANDTKGFFGIASEITSRINFLVSTGDALLLAEPTLSARSGGEAEFLSGGELPIPTTGALGQTNVEFKEFGISLRIRPVVDTENNIVARVFTEVSAIDSSVAVQGIPGFLTRKTETDISMRAGETLVISGLVNQDAAEDLSKLKFFGDIPVLGALFRSTNFRNRKSELVIFVTPTVVDATDEANRARMAKQNDLVRRFKAAVDSEDIEILE
jgi:pilus assembly protein CpaC